MQDFFHQQYHAIPPEKNPSEHAKIYTKICHTKLIHSPLGVANVQTFAIDELLASRKTTRKNASRKKLKLVGDTNISAFRSWLVKACSQNVKVTGISIMASKIRVHDMAGHDIKNNQKLFVFTSSMGCPFSPWRLQRHQDQTLGPVAG